MFSKSTEEKRNKIIIYLRINSLSALGLKYTNKLYTVKTAIQKGLIGKNKTYVLEKYLEFSNSFKTAQHISMKIVTEADDKDIPTIFNIFKKLTKEEERFLKFYNEDLVYILRQRFGFNPLESESNLLQAIELECPKDGKIPKLIENPV